MEAGKRLIIVALVAGLCLVAFQQASARGWGGGPGGDCSCQGYGPGYQQLDEATKAKVDAFRSETKALRKQIAMKRAEERALMKSATPDAKAVAEVAGEIFDLKSSLAEKAEKAGVPMMTGQRRMERSGGGRRPPPCAGQQGQGQGWK